MASDAIRNEAMLRADADAAAENSPSRCSKPSVVRNIICVYLDPFVKKNEYKYSRLFRFFKHRYAKIHGKMKSFRRADGKTKKNI